MVLPHPGNAPAAAMRPERGRAAEVTGVSTRETTMIAAVDAREGTEHVEAILDRASEGPRRVLA